MLFNDLTHAPIQSKVRALIERNIEHGKLYKDQTMLRQQYLAQHATALFVYKCMDGRIHLPVITKTPFGIMQPFRSLGGKFNLGWPFLSDYVKNLVYKRVNEGRNCLFVVTYHFSKGSKERCCAGFDHNTEAAYASTLVFKAQIDDIFGKRNSVVYPIIVGLETDGDGLIFHNNGDTINLYDHLETPADNLFELFRNLYADMPATILNDLMPLVFGNIEHIKEIKTSNREVIDMEHKEWVIGLGKGFDWLHAPNTALIVGPWSPEWHSEDLYKAFSIVKNNIDNGKISDDGFILLTSSIWEESPEDGFAIQKVKFFSDTAMKLAREKFPEIVPKIHLLPVIVNDKTKVFEDISRYVNLN